MQGKSYGQEEMKDEDQEMMFYLLRIEETKHQVLLAKPGRMLETASITAEFEVPW